MATKKSMPLRPNPDVVAQRMGDETVLIHLHTNRIYELNRTGTRFWELLAAGNDPATIRATLLNEFAIDPATLDGEIARIQTDLLAAGLARAAG